MKRLVTLALIIAVGMMLTACKSQAVKEVEAAISGIGIITEDSGSELCAAEELYNRLSEKEQANVSNQKTLEAAREEYEKQAEAKISELIKSRNWADAQNYLEYMDVQTITRLQNSIVSNLRKSLSNFAPKPSEIAVVNAGLDIMEQIGANEDENGQQIVAVLEGMQDYLKESVLWQDCEQLMSLYDLENVLELLSVFMNGNYTEKMSAISLIDLYVSAIVYDGTEENALRYIAGLNDIRDGMNTVKTGIQKKNIALTKTGLEQMQAGAAVLKELLEEQRTYIEKRLKVLRAAEELAAN